MNKKKIVFIGIIEDKRYKKTMRIAEKVLKDFNYRFVFSNKMRNILYLEKDFQLLVLINMDPKDMNFYQLIGIEFDILIHNFMEEDDYKRELLKEQFTECEYYILNSDDKNWTLLPLGNLDGVAVTYGFNSKATLTLSSYNINQVIEANFCLQRSLVSIFGKMIEPFEFTIEISSKNKDDIYPVLAVSILNLILYDEDNIIDSYKRIRF